MPPIVMAPPVIVTVEPTLAANVMLLAICVPVTVMLPVFVVACGMIRSLADEVVEIKVPEPPVELEFQKALVPFHAPTTVLKPAVVR